MTLQSFCLFAFIGLGVPTLLHAQDAETLQQQGRSSTNEHIYEPDELVLRYFQPTSSERREVRNLVDEIYGRRLMVSDDAGGARITRNLYELGEMIAVFETAERCEKILQALEEIDKAVATQERERAAKLKQVSASSMLNRSSDLVTLSYTPRFVDARSLGSALQPLTRDFQVQEADGNWYSTMNLKASDSPPVILIRDTQANVDLILSEIKKIDRPLPQVMLTAYLIRPTGYVEPVNHTVVPEELSKNLAYLTPYKDFEGLALSSIRTNVSSRGETVLVLHHPSAKYDLDLRGLSFDEQTRCLTVGSALLRRNTTEEQEVMGKTQSFTKAEVAMQTSFSAVAGEYAVIGLSEEDGAPLLLAITFRAIPQPKVDRGTQARETPSNL